VLLFAKGEPLFPGEVWENAWSLTGQMMSKCDKNIVFIKHLQLVRRSLRKLGKARCAQRMKMPLLMLGTLRFAQPTGRQLPIFSSGSSGLG